MMCTYWSASPAILKDILSLDIAKHPITTTIVNLLATERAGFS